MTIIVTTQATQAYERFKLEVASFKDRVNALITHLETADPVESEQLLSAYVSLGRTSARLSAFVLIAGITAEAQAVEDDPAYDVVAEVNALISAIASAETWIETNFPQYNGYLLQKSFNSGAIDDRTFSAAAVTDLRTLLANITALIG